MLFRLLLNLVLSYNVELDEIKDDLDMLTDPEKQFIYQLYEKTEIV